MIVKNEVGLHARPASVFVQTASKFQSRILVRNMNSQRPAVNAKSILQVLTLGVDQNTPVEITAEGEDEERAVAALEELIGADFNQ